jgi:hypothetical protein
MQLVTPLNAVLMAEEYARRAGFVRIVNSAKSEASYWRLPGRRGALRIAAHKGGNKERRFSWHDDVVAKVTFPQNSANVAGFIEFADHAIEFQAAQAIGLYMIRAGREPEINVEPLRAAASLLASP